MVPYEDRYRIISEVDVVITATASSHSVIRLHEMPQLSRPLTFMDMAVPQDVEPRCGKAWVTLYGGQPHTYQ